MTKLYVANATRQHQSFIWHPLGTRSPKVQPIPIGAQIQVSGVETPHEAATIIEQHEKYGMISADEVKKLRGPFYGLFYSLDKAISAEQIRAAMDKRQETIVEKGREIRALTAISINEGLENSLEQNAEPGSALRNLDMSIVEEEPAGGYVKPSGEKPIGEGYRIGAGNEPSAAPPRASRRGGRRS